MGSEADTGLWASLGGSHTSSSCCQDLLFALLLLLVALEQLSRRRQEPWRPITQESRHQVFPAQPGAMPAFCSWLPCLFPHLTVSLQPPIDSQGSGQAADTFHAAPLSRQAFAFPQSGDSVRRAQGQALDP